MKILVLTAFLDEAKSLITSLEDIAEISFAKRKCFHGKASGHDIYVSFSGIGTTSAAATATALCERLEPDCIIMCGSAGGLTAGQNTGDIVVGASVVDIDLYTLPRALTGTPYEPCLTDPHLAKPLVFEFLANPLFLSVCTSSSLSNVKPGKIVTSNTFPAPEPAFKTIKELGCNAIEMESTGVLNAVAHYDVPTIIIRAISNSLDEEGKDLGTPETALTTCSNRIRDFLKDLFTRIHELSPMLEEKKSKTIIDLVTKFGLERHPEGGYYRRVYRSEDLVTIPTEPGRYAEIASIGRTRPSMTSIYYLVEEQTTSVWHRIKSDEMWHFYHGKPLEIYELTPSGELKATLLGNPIEYPGAIPQYTVARGNWFAVKTTGLFSLCGCNVSPGFEFADFEFGKQEELITSFPIHAETIKRLSRDTHFDSTAARRDGFIPTLSFEISSSTLTSQTTLASAGAGGAYEPMTAGLT